jgi:hypothetical protein
VSLLSETYDNLMAFAAAGPLAGELAQARRDYVARTGELIDHGQDYERRIVAFLEWYVIDRPTALHGVPPVILYERAHAAQMDAAARDALDAWRTARASLFAVRRLAERAVALDDLITGAERQVMPTSHLLGLRSGDVLIARVVAYPPGQRVTDGVCYFPRQAGRPLQRFARGVRRAQMARAPVPLLHKLVALAGRCERYRHVDPRRIFAEGISGLAEAGRGEPPQSWLSDAPTASAPPVPAPRSARTAP